MLRFSLFFILVVPGGIRLKGKVMLYRPLVQFLSKTKCKSLVKLFVCYLTKHVANYILSGGHADWLVFQDNPISQTCWPDILFEQL